MGTITEPLDLLIVGAGISGIGMAAHFKRKCPGKSFALLERRTRLGGTWDLFRYPGVRSDSDMYTLGYDFEPWRDDHAIADGAKIRDYLSRVAERRDLLGHISFGQQIVAADWAAAAGLWTVTKADGSALQARFVFFGTGYYDYDAAHDAQIPGLSKFAGEVLQPQFWPEEFDYSGKRVVIIGSGATAITMVPAMAKRAAHVTMLQRTPSWLVRRPVRDALANGLKRILPTSWAAGLMRNFNARMQAWLYKRCRTAPVESAAWFTNELRKELGEAYDEQAFTPPYNPWDQRLCVVPDGDFFDAVKQGKASVVTGTIASAEPEGVRLDDGRHIAADIIVLATGLKLSFMGKTAISLDGVPVHFPDHFYYRSCMFSNVPNLAGLFGYLNAGWTLRVDLVADWLCRLFNHMDAWGREVVTPVLAPDHDLIEDNPIDAFTSGYLQRARPLIPKSTGSAPWRIGMNYLEDRKELRSASIDDGVLRFERVSLCAASSLP